MIRGRVYRDYRTAGFMRRSLRNGRTRKIQNRTADAKLFGKYNEIVMMLLGFVLTGVVGTYIAQVYTVKNAELVAANKIFADHNKLIGDRYFAMGHVQQVLAENQKNPEKWDALQVEAAWNLYRTDRQAWNSTRGYNRELIRLYFGNGLYNDERDIHYSLRAWGQSLELEQRHGGSIDFECLDRKVDDFLIEWHAFSFRLAEAIQKDKIGSNKPSLSVKENPRPDAPCLTDRSKALVRPSATE